MRRHRQFTLVLVCLIASIRAVCADEVPNGKIISSTQFHPPAYSELHGIARYATEEEYRRAISDKRFSISKLIYSSDGLEVVGYLYGPAGDHGGKLPVIVFNRGNYVVKGEVGLYLASFWRLASDGFLVFAPMYRGSDGASGHDEMGGADVDDLVNAIKTLDSIRNADVSNVFLYGESRGGLMTLLGIREGAPVRAAVTVGAITDLQAFFRETPQLEAQMATAIWPDYRQSRDAIIGHRSAVRWADRIRIPVLLMHGGNDQSVSPMHSLRMAEALQEANREYGLMIFADDNHVLSKNREERDAKALRWFRSHIAGATSTTR